MKNKRFLGLFIFLFILISTFCYCKDSEKQNAPEFSVDVAQSEALQTGNAAEILESSGAEEAEVLRYASRITDCKWDAQYMNTYFISDSRCGFIGPVYEDDRLRWQIWMMETDEQTQVMSFCEFPQNRLIMKAQAASDVLYLITQTIDSSVSSQEITYLSALSYDGAVLWEKRLKEIIAYSEANSVSLHTDVNENLWLMDFVGQQIVYASQDGSVLAEFDGKEQNISRLVEDKNGSMYGISIQPEDTALHLYKISQEDGIAADPVVIEKNGISAVYAGVSGEFILQQGRYLIDYYMVSQEEKILCDVINTGISAESILDIKPMQDGSILLLSGMAGMKECAVVTLIKEFTVDDILSQNIILACLQADDLLRETVASYNRGGHGYTVKIKEYYDAFQTDAGIEDALTRLNADLADGTAGDILDLTGLAQYAAREQYVRMGVLEELYRWIDRDPDISREDYLPSLWAANEIKGSLYNLVPLYTVNTKIGTASEMEGVLFTLEQMLSAEVPSYVFGPEYLQEDFWHDFCVFYLQNLTDIPDQDTLAAVLQFAGQLPKEWNSDLSHEYNNALYEKKMLLSPTGYRYGSGIYRNLSNYTYQMAHRGKYLLGEEIDETRRRFAELDGSDLQVLRDFYASQGAVPVCNVGFPSQDGCGSSFVNLISLGICTASENKTGAWDFLKYTLSEESQSQIDERFKMYSIPAKISVWEEVCEENCALKWDFWMSGGADDNGTAWEVYVPQLTTDIVAQYNALAASITVLDEVNPMVIRIVMDEAETYNQGMCSAQDAAAAILNRLTLYQNEIQ